jgi:DHA1 family bicyclomycin/chloramphenicol resistance-like MFS transporter
MLDSLRSNPSARGLAAIYGGTLLSGAWAMVIPSIPALAGEFEVSAGAAAQIVTAAAMGKFLGTIGAGVLLDRTGTRLSIIGGPLLGCGAALLCAIVPWFSALLVLTLCIGAADSLGAIAREFAALDVARRNQRGRLISSMHGTHNVGAAIAPFAGGWLAEAFGFQAAFLGYAVCCGFMAVLGALSPHLPPPEPERVPAKPEGWGLAALKQRMRALAGLVNEIRPELRPTFFALVLATLASQSQRIIVQSMLPLYAGVYLDLSPSQIGMLFTISGIVVFAMIIPAGFIMDRIGRKWCTVPSTGAPALVFLLIPLADSFTQLAVLTGIAGFAQGLSLGSLATSTYDVVPAHARGRLQALRRTAAELGSGVAPLIGGYLANRFNPGVPFLVYAPLLLVSATWLALVGQETLEK